MILYATLAKGPKLSPEDQANSTRHFMRELNRLGVTERASTPAAASRTTPTTTRSSTTSPGRAS